MPSCYSDTLFVTLFFRFLVTSENNLQEDLFDQILAGKLEFPAPYWDNITDSAKVLCRALPVYTVGSLHVGL
jgi:hypothetical protein